MHHNADLKKKRFREATLTSFENVTAFNLILYKN